MAATSLSETKLRQILASFVGGQLVESVWLRRLARVSFLGTLDFHPKSRRASNRYAHSLGVAGLAMDVCEDLALPECTARHFVAACLLHDVGHYPLSHAAEPAFSQQLGANHHEVGRWLVCGTGPISRMKSLVRAILDCGLDPERIWGIIDGHATQRSDEALCALLGAPINLDTLDGIRRAAKDFRIAAPRLPEGIFCWFQGELALTPRGCSFADAFWSLKDRVYANVINLPSNIVAEARLCDRVAESQWPELFENFDRFDDDQLLRTMELRPANSILCAHNDQDFELRAQPGFGQVMQRSQKRYWVNHRSRAGDPEDPLPLSAWKSRYCHRKVNVSLVTRRTQLDLPCLNWHEQGPEI